MENTSQIYLLILPEKGEIGGETQAGGYEGRIEIESFSFNAKAKIDTLDALEAKLSTKDPLESLNNLDLKTVTITKVFDNASLRLAGMLKGRERIGTEREGIRFSEAEIHVDQHYIQDRSEAKLANQILIVTLYDGYITDIKFRTSEAGAGAQITEDVEISFKNFEFLYYGYQSPSDIGSTWRPIGISHRTTNREDQAS